MKLQGWSGVPLRPWDAVFIFGSLHMRMQNELCIITPVSEIYFCCFCFWSSSLWTDELGQNWTTEREFKSELSRCWSAQYSMWKLLRDCSFKRSCRWSDCVMHSQDVLPGAPQPQNTRAWWDIGPHVACYCGTSSFLWSREELQGFVSWWKANNSLKHKYVKSK